MKLGVCAIYIVSKHHPLKDIQIAKAGAGGYFTAEKPTELTMSYPNDSHLFIKWVPQGMEQPICNHILKSETNCISFWKSLVSIFY